MSGQTKSNASGQAGQGPEAPGFPQKGLNDSSKRLSDRLPGAVGPFKRLFGPSEDGTHEDVVWFWPEMGGVLFIKPPPGSRRKPTFLVLGEGAQFITPEVEAALFTILSALTSTSKTLAEEAGRLVLAAAGAAGAGQVEASGPAMFDWAVKANQLTQDHADRIKAIYYQEKGARLPGLLAQGLAAPCSKSAGAASRQAATQSFQAVSKGTSKGTATSKGKGTSKGKPQKGRHHATCITCLPACIPSPVPSALCCLQATDLTATAASLRRRRTWVSWQVCVCAAADLHHAC